MGQLRAYEEFIDFIAAGPSSRKVIAFRPSEATRQRAFVPATWARRSLYRSRAHHGVTLSLVVAGQ